MGKTQNTGNLTNALAQDSSNNIGIGGAANASFKLRVTGSSAGDSVYAIGDGASSGGALKIKQYASSAANEDGYSTISTLNTGVFYFTSASTSPNFKNFVLNPSGLTDNTLITYTLPNASGTLALTSDLGSYLPLTGGTLTGALSGTSATFTSTLAVNGAATLGTGASSYTFGGGSSAAGGLTDKDLTLKAWSPTSGTNEYSGDLILQSGVGTGNGSGKLGSVIIKVGTDGATSSTLGTYITSTTFTKTGVGIGTSTPEAKLQVAGTVEANGSLYRAVFGTTVQDADMTGITGGNGSEVQIQSPSTTRGAFLTIGGGMAFGEAMGGIAFYNSNNVDGKRNRAFIVGGQEGATAGEQGSYLSFGTVANTVSVPSERMRITSGGNVGIGTSSPTALLHLGVANAAVDGTKGVKITNPAGTTVMLECGVSSDSFVGTTSASDFSIRTGNAERMRITSGGNVGIGTSSPQTFLHVLGSNTSGRGQLCIQSNNASNAAKATWYYDTTQQGEIGTTGGDFYALAVNNFPFYAGGSERMRITLGGSLLVGSTSALNSNTSIEGLVNVNGDSYATFRNDGGGTSTRSRVDIVSNSNFTALIQNSSFHSSPGQFAIFSTGSRITIVAGSAGVFLASGATSWSSNSDERLKNITGNIDNAVQSLMTLKAIKHTWKNNDDNKQHYALIAQDIEKVFPEIIDKGILTTDDKGTTDGIEYLGVRYTELIPILVKAIQELTQKVNALENK